MEEVTLHAYGSRLGSSNVMPTGTRPLSGPRAVPARSSVGDFTVQVPKFSLGLSTLLRPGTGRAPVGL